MKFKKLLPYEVTGTILIDTLVTCHKAGNDFVQISPSGNLRILDGYRWDGATCAIDTMSFMMPSAVHDALYQLIGLGVLSRDDRVWADDELYRVCIADGMWRYRAFLWWVAVRAAGGPFAASESPDLDKVYYAPEVADGK